MTLKVCLLYSLWKETSTGEAFTQISFESLPTWLVKPQIHPANQDT